MIVYKVTCIPTGKIYIGITRQLLAKRWRQHCSEARRSRFDTVFYRAMRSHGEDAFIIEPIHLVGDAQEAQRLERETILALGTMAPGGLNTSTGGESHAGIARHPEVIARMAASKRGRKVVWSDEARARKALTRGVKRSDAAMAGLLAASADPEIRRMRKERLKRRWEDPEYRARHNALTAKVRSDPEFQKRRLEGIQRAKEAGHYRGRPKRSAAAALAEARR